MIGIFDSGLGGLTIFKEIEKKLPDYDYLYLGDNARAPYGDHSQETVLRYTQEAVSYLFEQGCILVILACNTASAEALRALQQRWLPAHYPERNVLGVTIPLAEAAVVASRQKRIGVMATRSTVESHAFKKEIKKLDSKTAVTEQACRLLVPLIEEGYENTRELRMILKKYVRPLKSHAIDTLILGCTHYGIIEKDIRRYYGSNVEVLNSGAIVAEKLAAYVARHPEYAGQLSRKNARRFLTTEATGQVQTLAARFLGRPVAVEVVRLIP